LRLNGVSGYVELKWGRFTVDSSRLTVESKKISYGNSSLYFMCKVFCNYSGSRLESNEEIKATNREPFTVYSYRFTVHG
jgi:hypothetical protein